MPGSRRQAQPKTDSDVPYVVVDHLCHQHAASGADGGSRRRALCRRAGGFVLTAPYLSKELPTPSPVMRA